MEDSSFTNEGKSSETPDDILVEDLIFDMEFHPSKDFIALGMITGHTKFFQYSSEEGNRLIYDWKHTKKAVRALQYALDGTVLITASADCALRAIDLNTGKLGYASQRAHDAPINALMTHLDSMLVTGDDNGCIKLWDLRKQGCCFEWHEHEDFISGFASNGENNTLLATGGDGYLSVMHLRKGTLEAMSDQMEDELLSIAIVKEGRKVVVGTQEGAIAIWSWDDWGDMSDRFVGHPNSVDSIVVLDQDTIATGSSDGIIRVCNILPNKFLGAIGEHGEFPVERVRLSRDKRMLASCSHDNSVKFWAWDNEELQNGEGEDMEEAMETEQEQPKKPKGFFSDLL